MKTRNGGEKYGTEYSFVDFLNFGSLISSLLGWWNMKNKNRTKQIFLSKKVWNYAVSNNRSIFNQLYPAKNVWINFNSWIFLVLIYLSLIGTCVIEKNWGKKLELHRNSSITEEERKLAETFTWISCKNWQRGFQCPGATVFPACSVILALEYSEAVAYIIQKYMKKILSVSLDRGTWPAFNSNDIFVAGEL